MRKLFILLSIIFFSTNVFADKMKKDGFLNNKVGYSKDQKISDPENKILLIYNHGQKNHDGPSSDCAWKGGIKNISSLVGEKIKDYHDMDRADCFKYYNSTILNFIASRVD